MIEGFHERGRRRSIERHKPNKGDWSERAKMYYDLTKHMTTLSTGSTLLIVTMYEKITRVPSWKFLVPLSVTLFLASLALCLMAMLGFAAYEKARDNTPHDPSEFAVTSFMCAILAFWSGICALVGFLWKNAL